MTTLEKSNGIRITIDKLPNECPHCHSKIVVEEIYVNEYEDAEDDGRYYEAVFLCPDATCSKLFIATYIHLDETNIAYLIGSEPNKPVERSFQESINKLSKQFCSIYNEASAAESYNLTQICGGGYRKALEFLIKDYLLMEQPADAAAIKKALLGTCIDKYVSDERIKQIAKRATWLGNDEVHYERRWENKDLGDLKRMIDLVLHWIEQVQLTQEILASMPEGKN